MRLQDSWGKKVRLAESTRRSGSYRVTWDVLDRFGQALQPASVEQQRTAILNAVLESTESDAVFWGPGPGGHIQGGQPPFQTAGHGRLTPKWCQRFLAHVLRGWESSRGQIIRAFLDPGSKPISPWPFGVALVRTSRSQGSWLATLSFHPARLFGSADLHILTLARRLIRSIHRQNKTIEQLHETMVGLVRSLTITLDARDPFTWGHSTRVAQLAVWLGQQMDLPQSSVHDLYLAWLLHDLGKVGLSDEILRKAGPLSPEEQAHVAEHPLIGERLLAGLPPLRHLRSVVRHHHERFDGNGYPDGLAGRDIPLLARILAVADACEAMRSPRHHRTQMTPSEVEATLQAGAGTQWDPWVVDRFLACRNELAIQLTAWCRDESEGSLLNALESALEGRLHPSDKGNAWW